MCRIAGWLDFDRNLTVKQPTVQPMTETMYCYGIEAERFRIAQY